jgi:hypothetical protein
LAQKLQNKNEILKKNEIKRGPYAKMHKKNQEKL